MTSRVTYWPFSLHAGPRPVPTTRLILWSSRSLRLKHTAVSRPHARPRRAPPTRLISPSCPCTLPSDVRRPHGLPTGTLVLAEQFRHACGHTTTAQSSRPHTRPRPAPPTPLIVPFTPVSARSFRWHAGPRLAAPTCLILPSRPHVPRDSGIPLFSTHTQPRSAPPTGLIAGPALLPLLLLTAPPPSPLARPSPAPPTRLIRPYGSRDPGVPCSYQATDTPRYFHDPRSSVQAFWGGGRTVRIRWSPTFPY